MPGWALFLLFPLLVLCGILLGLALDRIFSRAKTISPNLPSSILFLLTMPMAWMTLVSLVACVESILASTLVPFASTIALISGGLAILIIAGMALIVILWRRSRGGPPRLLYAVNVPTQALVDAANSTFQKLNLTVQTQRKFLTIELRSELGILLIPIRRRGCGVMTDRQLHQRHPEFIAKLMEEIVSRDASIVRVTDSIDCFKRDFVLSHCLMMLAAIFVWVMRSLHV